MEQKKSKPGLLSRVFTRKGATVLSAGGQVPAASVGGSAASGAFSGSNNSAATSENLKKTSVEFNDYLKEVDTADLENHSHSVLKMTRWLEKQQAYSNSGFQPNGLRDFTM
ncbi:uncharacterized protein ALTATR162_LOCUS7822 [Alternaria atra]|uniref:Uncharacterized protein n=1 Tax=Alternaria atra TaxID=119953 RepID=A0A8J2N250_9PLEO|nr:uncharacterized protein ALTATR162_LOCUS7822 [Alternaria atra]CAG5174610.1 unnamed protein product [Alternaria atra]